MTVDEQMAERSGKIAMKAWHERNAVNICTLRGWNQPFGYHKLRRQKRLVREVAVEQPIAA
jgi:hypothetical protein